MRRISYIFPVFLVFLLISVSPVFSLPFNSQLSTTDLQKLNSGEILVRNIDYAKNMSIQSGVNARCDELISMVKGFNPKYLGEVILIKPYRGNEDLPDRINELLNNIDSYTDIPYYSEHAERWYNLYDEAETVSKTVSGNKTVIKTNLVMQPVGLIEEQIEVINEGNTLIYKAENTNSLKYEDTISFLSPGKMKIGIVVFRDGANWVIYGAGGINAPHIPFLTDRIRVSFINRICSFCDYIFKKL